MGFKQETFTDIKGRNDIMTMGNFIQSFQIFYWETCYSSAIIRSNKPSQAENYKQSKHKWNTEENIGN